MIQLFEVGLSNFREGELIAKLLSIVDYDTVVEKSTAMPPKLDFLCINEK